LAKLLGKGVNWKPLGVLIKEGFPLLIKKVLNWGGRIPRNWRNGYYSLTRLHQGKEGFQVIWPQGFLLKRLENRNKFGEMEP